MSACKKSILVFIGIAIFFGFAILSNIWSDNRQINILWSMPVGIILGIATCWYISTSYSYDLTTQKLKPTKTDAPFANTNGLWGPPLGVLLANIISRFLGPVIASFVFECTGVWLLITIGFIGFLSCRSKTREKKDFK